MDRFRKQFLEYERYLKNKNPSDINCNFCHPEHPDMKIVAEHTYFYVKINSFSYNQWELRQVIEHLLIVPRRHIPHLGLLSADESLELMKLLGHFEQAGYDIFARAPNSVTRTVVHQHTHLIKSESRRARGVLFWRRPYILKLFR